MDLSEPISSIEQLTAESLTERLRSSGFLSEGHVVSIESTEQFDSSAALWERLVVEYSSDYVGTASEAMLLKLYRDGWFGGGVVEWTFYNELAAQTPDASVCEVYDCGIDKENRVCHFILEDVSVTHTLAPPKDERPYEDAIREFGKYHVRWWGDERLNEWPFAGMPGGPLRMAAAVAPEKIRESAQKFEDSLKGCVDTMDDFDPEWTATIERVIQRYPEVFIERIADSNGVTMLHGDAHLWNYAYPKDPSTHRMILMDWETFKRGLAPYDLAYMLVHGTSNRKDDEDRLMTFYYDEVLTPKVDGYSREQFEYDYRLSVAACVFCPLIWKRVFSFKSAIGAYRDWDCEGLLG